MSKPTTMPKRHLTAEPRVDSSAPPMLRYQSALPSLPVPTLSSTLSKYLATVQPLLTPSQFAHTQKSADAFLSSPLAADLQKRLQERAERVGDNWLSEWWNDVAYMGYRDPVVVFVSYFFVHVQDRTRKEGTQRAADLVKAMLPFRAMVENGTLEPDKIKDTPLCMDSYKWLFHAARYPTIPSDTAEKFPLSASTNHLVVLRKNRFYVVPLTHPSSPSQELSSAELQIQFQRILKHAGPTPHPTPLGALTSSDRDSWTAARQALLAASPANATLLRKIESAMIILCLDDNSPVTREDVSWGAWVGNGRNRWYDKHQLIVYENGRSGFLGEHSCMDGTPTLRMNEFTLGSLALRKADLGPPISASTGTDLPHPEELVFTTDERVRTLVREAEDKFDALVADHELHVLHYEAYGSAYIKTHKVSPDAWAQLVKQLAFFKMHGRLGVTYESAQTRRFKKGRTEVVRSVSSEGAEWVRAMLDPSAHKDPIHIRTLFHAAVKRHMTYSSWAANGEGVDRHLFGLKKSLKEGEELPELYKDEAYSKSSHWEMSTSQLSSPLFDGWGYGEVVPDGYGLAYALGSHYMRWTITSRREMRPTEMRHYLTEAATEVRDMMEAARKADAEKQDEVEGKAKL